MSGSPTCSLCLFRHVCRDAPAADLSPNAQKPLQPAHATVTAGDAFFRQGRPIAAVYPLREGSAKQVYESPLGWRQVTGFSLSGDVLGLEPNEAPAYSVSSIALQDTLCCVVSIEALRSHMADPAFRNAVLDVMRHQAERERILLVAVGSMKAAQRLAMLLLDLDAEHRRRGGADSPLTLTMSRTDIASLLGLTLETVSRLLSRFASVGLISVRQRRLRLIDRDGLAAVYAELDPMPRHGPVAMAAQAVGDEPHRF
ncbi:helix-turn-helix domain-containing protein [Cupriavidus sp. WKF15]|uniref:Crp/Fnr family transcriptional regulator n=1 Tax=Cupriavidus sp. WKF15 TaxID=3032282 RepID=UPI0023E130C0|nr:helix-turn-helix domain-containing protein [Cupriavidus sp. WKF15]WER47880.1 helix-turn-helix domain-containing protein [Cupriavidus sp. WKF15]